MYFTQLISIGATRLFARFALVAAMLGVVACPAQQLASLTASGQQDLQAIAQKWLRAALMDAQPSADVALRMEANVAAPDPRLRLAPCSNVEVYVPNGTSLWGHTRVGLRCNDGQARWNIGLPVVVKAVGPAWVVKNHVPSGATLSEGDLVQSEVDWAEDMSPVVQDKQAWIGQTSTRLLTTGQTLRQNMIRAAQVFSAGATVRVVVQGNGFQISADGEAISAGIVGQSARVRMDNGRVTNGIVLDGKTVKIDL